MCYTGELGEKGVVMDLPWIKNGLELGDAPVGRALCMFVYKTFIRADAQPVYSFGIGWRNPNTTWTHERLPMKPIPNEDVLYWMYCTLPYELALNKVREEAL